MGTLWHQPPRVLTLILTLIQSSVILQIYHVSVPTSLCFQQLLSWEEDLGCVSLDFPILVDFGVTVSPVSSLMDLRHIIDLSLFSYLLVLRVGVRLQDFYMSKLKVKVWIYDFIIYFTNLSIKTFLRLKVSIENFPYK